MTNNNESLGLAGWLFADLLLGLVVIFLAIGYVFPGDDSSEAAPTTTTSTTTTTTTITTTTTTTTLAIASCESIDPPEGDTKYKDDPERKEDELKQANIDLDWAYNDPDRLREEIENFLNPLIKVRLVNEGLHDIKPEDIKIGYVLVGIGAGLNPSRAEEREAIARAEDFIEQLGVVMPDRFERISGQASWGRNTRNNIVLRYFPRVPSTDCP